MATPRRTRRFLLCISTKGYDDLEPRKLYEQLPDRRGATEGFVRVIDEPGDDYLDPAACFVAVELSRDAEDALGSGSR